MKKLIWFKVNSRGNGWYPATWQGWVVQGICILLNVVAIIVFIPLVWHTLIMVGAFILVFVCINVLFMLVCFKTGEPIQWKERKKK